MSISLSYAVSVSGAGVSIQKSVVRSGEAAIAYEVSLPAGYPVTAWVKTDADTAACNFAGGHGQTNGNFDVYWTAGGTNYVRRGVPGTITTNALALDGGAGTDFPATATSGVVVCKQVVITTLIDGDNAGLVVAIAEYADQASTARCSADFQDGGSATILAATLNANEPQVYDIEGGATNVFTGNVIESIKASNASTSATATLKISGVQDVSV